MACKLGAGWSGSASRGEDELLLNRVHDLGLRAITDEGEAAWPSMRPGELRASDGTRVSGRSPSGAARGDGTSSDSLSDGRGRVGLRCNGRTICSDMPSPRSLHC